MNYTERQVKRLIEVYTANPCMEAVNKLSVELNKPKKSIIGKLSKEGVYETRGYLSKTGERPITKLQIVRSIEDALDTKLPGLDKTPKPTLKELNKTVIDVVTLLEDSLEELRKIYELDKIKKEMNLKFDEHAALDG